MRQAPPPQMTLSSQHVQMQALERNRWERRMRSRWNRMFLSLFAVHRCKVRREAVREVATARAARVPAATPSMFHMDSRSSEPTTQAIEDDVILATQLGLDVGTYRLLLQLEGRDILPEDYDLLG